MKHNGGYDTLALAAELYDHVESYRNRNDAPFFVEAAVAAGGPVLELGCGTGRILLPTAEAGVEVVGIDRSLRMLRLCRDHLANRQAAVRSRVRLVQADMRHLHLAPVFRLATAPFRIFQFLTTNTDQYACLRCLHRLLVPGGVLLLDLAVPTPELFSLHDIGHELSYEPAFVLPDGRRVIRRHRYIRKDRCRQKLDFHVISVVTHPDGRQERLVQRFSMRYLHAYEAESLLTRCGFEIRRQWAGYERTRSFSREDSDLVIEAVRV